MKSTSDITIVETFKDDGFSGTDFKRPGFQAMLKAIENKEINCIIVKDLSRFGRELSNFILGAVFTGTAGLIYKKNKTKKGAIIGAIVGSVIMGIISFPSNLFIVYPAYEKFTPINEIMDAYSKLLPSVGKLWQALLIFNVPFTIVKGLISTLITVLIYKRLSPVLKGRG